MTETSENSFSFMGKDFSTFMENAKRTGGFNPVHIDLGLLMELQCKNVDAMAAIGKGVIDAMQGFMRRQTELVCKGIEEMEALEKAAMASGSAEEATIRQAQASKCLWERSMANMQDGMDTMAKCNANAMELMSQCLEDNFKGWHEASKFSGGAKPQGAKEAKQAKDKPKDSA